MSFNVSALDAFRNVNLGGDNAIAMVTTYLSDHVSELFHIQENILAGEKNIALFADLKDPQKQITDYLTRTIQAFVSTSLDAFLDAEKAGKIENYLSYLGGTWPCVEGKTTGITEFRLTTCLPDDTGPVATHDKDWAKPASLSSAQSPRPTLTPSARP